MHDTIRRIYIIAAQNNTHLKTIPTPPTVPKSYIRVYASLSTYPPMFDPSEYYSVGLLMPEYTNE